MRVTDSGSFAQTQRQLEVLSSRYTEALNEASTGMRVSKPSDDPAAVFESQRIHSAIRQADRIFKNADMVETDGVIAESALAEASSLMQEARSAAVQGANGAFSTEGRLALAEQVAAQRAQMISLANTEGTEGFLFGGTLTDTPPFDDAGVFQGNAHPKNVELAPGRASQANVDGAKAFTSAGGIDVFDLLGSLETALRSDDPDAVRGLLPDFEQAGEQVSAGRSDAGSLITRAKLAKAALEQSRIALVERDASLTNSDLNFALSRLTGAQSALEQALMVAQKTVLRPREF